MSRHHRRRSSEGSSSGSASSRSRRSRSRRSRSVKPHEFHGRRKHHKRSRSESSSPIGTREANTLATRAEPYVIRGGQRVCYRDDKHDGLQDQSAGRECSLLPSTRSGQCRRSLDRWCRHPDRSLRRATSWLKAGAPPVPYALLCPVWPMLLPKAPASPSPSLPGGGGGVVARPPVLGGGSPFPFVAWPFGLPVGATESAVLCGQRDAVEGGALTAEHACSPAGHASLDVPGAASASATATRPPPLAPSRRFQHVQPSVPVHRRNLSCEVDFRGVEIRREKLSGPVQQSRIHAGRGKCVSTIPVILEKQSLTVEELADQGTVGSVGGKAKINPPKEGLSSVADHAIVPGSVSSSVTYPTKGYLRADGMKKMKDVPTKTVVQTHFQPVNQDKCEETCPVIIQVPGIPSVKYSGCSKCLQGLMPVLIQQSEKFSSEGDENYIITRSINSLKEIFSESRLTNKFTDHLQNTTIHQSMDEQSFIKGQKKGTQKNAKPSRRSGLTKHCRGDSEVTQSKSFRDEACGVEEQDINAVREVKCPHVGDTELKNIQSTQTSEEAIIMQRCKKGSETLALSSETERIPTKPKSNSRLSQIFSPATTQKVHSAQQLVECGVCTEEVPPVILSRSHSIQTDLPHPAQIIDTSQCNMQSYKEEFNQSLNKIRRNHIFHKNSVMTQTPLLVHHAEDKCLQSNFKEIIEQLAYHELLPLEQTSCLGYTVPLMTQERKHFSTQNERDYYDFGIAPEMSRLPKYATSFIHPNLTLPKQNDDWQTQTMQAPSGLSVNFADKEFRPYADLSPPPSWQSLPQGISCVRRKPEPSDTGKKELNVRVESEFQEDDIKKIVLNVVGQSENSLSLKNSKSISFIADTIAERLVERLKTSTNLSMESASSCLEKASEIINRRNEFATQTEQPRSQHPNSRPFFKKNTKTSQDAAHSRFEKIFRPTNPPEIHTETNRNGSKYTVLSSSPAYVDSLGAPTDWLKTWRSDCGPNHHAHLTGSKNKTEESYFSHNSCHLTRDRATVSSYKTQKVESATVNIWPKSDFSSGTNTLLCSSSPNAPQKQVQFSIPMTSEIQLPKVSTSMQRSMSKRMQTGVKIQTEDTRSSNYKQSPSSSRLKTQKVGRETSPSHARSPLTPRKPSQPSAQTTEETVRVPVTQVDVRVKTAGSLPSPKLASLQQHRVRKPSLKEARRVERPASRRVLQPRAVSSLMRAFRGLRPEPAPSDGGPLSSDGEGDGDESLSASPKDSRLKLLWSRSCLYSP